MTGMRALVSLVFSLPLAVSQCLPSLTNNGLVFTCSSYSSKLGNPRFDLDPWNALEPTKCQPTD